MWLMIAAATSRPIDVLMRRRRRRFASSRILIPTFIASIKQRAEAHATCGRVRALVEGISVP